MARYAFLSDDWFAEVDRIVAEEGLIPPDDSDVMINVRVTSTPFGSDRELHLGAVEGATVLGQGPAETADLTMVTDYETARGLFLEANPQGAMQAFLLGKLLVQGDLAKLVDRATANAAPLPGGPELVARLHDVTE